VGGGGGTKNFAGARSIRGFKSLLVPASPPSSLLPLNLCSSDEGLGAVGALLRGAEGDYAQWSKAHGGAYDGFLLSSANAFPAQLATVLEHLRHGRAAQAERCSAAISAAVADAFAAVVEVRQGNAFTNANKALAHIMAYGRDALEAPPPRLYAGSHLPHSILKVVMASAKKQNRC